MLCDRRLIFDVGLHRGEDSAYYLRLGYNVVGFEANPELVSHCRRRFAPEIRAGRFKLIDGAIASKGSKTVKFFQHPYSVFGTTQPDWSTRNAYAGDAQGIEVPAVDFEACLHGLGVPYFLKVDIEGADKLCFDALKRVEGRPRYLSLESEKVDFESLVAEFDMLTALGYSQFAVVQQAKIAHVGNATCLDGSPMAYDFEPDASGAFGPDVGPWLSRDQAIARYRKIFLAYRLLGDHSWMRRSPTRRAMLRRFGHVFHLPLPGWYDTHARRV